MLHIHSRERIRIGQVLCLHLAGKPEPDLSADDNPCVKLLTGMDSTSVHGVGNHFYACDKHGRILNQSETDKALMPMRINPAPDVNFIPVIQLRWDDVRKREGEEGKKYVVYNPGGALLQRLTRRNVSFGLPDGSVRIGDSYDPLYYRPGRRGFTLQGSSGSRGSARYSAGFCGRVEVRRGRPRLRSQQLRFLARGEQTVNRIAQL